MLILIFSVSACSQEIIYQLWDLPYYYTDLPYEFWESSNIKHQKLKKQTSFSSIKNHSGNYSNFTDIKEYDTNGIPINMTGLDTNNFYTAYHMTSDFLVDSSRYVLDGDGLLISRTQYFRTGYNYKYKYFYDAYGRCVQTLLYKNDTLIDDEFYKYDPSGRLIQKGNDSDYFRFEFIGDKITEIYRFRNNKKFTEYSYHYNDKENSRSAYRKGKTDKLVEKLFYDDDDFINIKIRYFERHDNEIGYIEKWKTVWERDIENNSILSKTYIIKGNVLVNQWEKLYKYNKNDNLLEIQQYNQWGQPEDRYKYLYEFYD